MKNFHPLIVAVGIPVWYALLTFAGFAFSGGGHGSSFFGEAMLSPISSGNAPLLGLIFWLAVGLLLAFRRFPVSRLAASIALLCHYAGICMLSLQTDWAYVKRVWQSLPVFLGVLLMAYLVSHIFMWGLIVSKPKIR